MPEWCIRLTTGRAVEVAWGGSTLAKDRQAGYGSELFQNSETNYRRQDTPRNHSEGHVES